MRSNTVREALIWLKENNQYYRDIIIDEGVLRDLLVDGDVSGLIPRIENLQLANRDNDQPLDNIIAGSGFPNIPVVNQERAIQDNLQVRHGIQRHAAVNIGDWPELNQDPMNEFRNEGIICKAFPFLFPYGRGDLNSPHLHRINNHQYFKYLMQYHDGRFAEDSRFPYYAYNSIARWDAINCGNVYVRLNQMDGFNADDIRALADNPNQKIAASIMYYGKNLRGTRAYWKQRCSELLQMVRELGIPTIFFTL